MPPPVGIALVVCDDVYRDSTGKCALIGLFNRINTDRLPAKHPKLRVFVSITEVTRFTECRLSIVHAQTEEPILDMRGQMPDGPPPTRVFDMVFELPGLEFPAAGSYYVRFLGNDQVLIQRPIEVVDMRGGPGHDVQIEPLDMRKALSSVATNTIVETATITVSSVPLIKCAPEGKGVPDDPTPAQRMRIMEVSGALEFWNRVEEDCYTEADGEPI
jgi:hypothetical protein